MTQPSYFEDHEHPSYVYKSSKVIYGLKKTTRAWFDTLSNALCVMGFIQSKVDFFFNFRHSTFIYLLVYAYDIIIIGER